MQAEFDMTDLGVMKYFLGIEIHQSDNGIFVGQQKLLISFKSSEWPIENQLIHQFLKVPNSSKKM